MTTTHDRPHQRALPAVTRRGPVRDLVGAAARLAEALATPLVPSDYLDLLDPLRSGADLRGRIVAVTPETADSATITIQPGRGWKGHVAGQYIRVGVDIDGVRHWRAYSLTHDARAFAGTITITPKVIEGGLVSTHLVRSTRPGTLVMLDQATGDFTLRDTEGGLPDRAFFLTGGSGITPVMGMLRSHLDELRGAERVVLVHCSPTHADMMFRDELEAWAAAGRLTLVENLDDRDGILCLDTLDRLVPDWHQRRAWVCGPTGLLDAAEAHWAAVGLESRLRTERFRPSFVEPGEGGEITFLDSDISVDADGSTPILDAGEDAGLVMPHGCRMGICFGCVVPMRQGAVRDLRTGEITTAEPGEDVTIQTCVNAVAGSCDLEL